MLAICPTAVDTRILDKGWLGDFNGREFYQMGQGSKSFYSADWLAADTLRAVERNKALLVTPRRAHAAWLFARLALGPLNRMAARFVAQQRSADRRSMTR